MTKKESFPYDKTHNAISLGAAVGKKIVCEDNVERVVTSIVHCAGSFQFAVVNEDLEKKEAGHHVHLLKLFAQLRKEAPPTAELIKQFDEIAKSWDFEYQGESGRGDGIFQRPKDKKKPQHGKTWFVNKGGKIQ